MNVYGLRPHREDATDPNNLHLIFLPVMTGYGLAFLSVLWTRLNLPLHIPVVRNGHFIMAIFISALPTMLTAPTRISMAVAGHELQRVNYPYYYPKLLVQYSNMVKKNEAIATDIPWAVAWYGNRAAIWLPKDRGQLERLREDGKLRGQPITGMLLSRFTLDSSPYMLTDARTENYPWREYVLWQPTLFFAKSETGRKDLFSLITSELPIKQPVSPLGSPYLFMTQEPVIRSENEAAAAVR
jgi:hypothetical protein